MEKWVDNLKTVEDEYIRLAIMTANNHYAGFVPRTVNIFRNMLGLSEAKYEDKQEEGDQQKHLEQYLTKAPESYSMISKTRRPEYSIKEATRFVPTIKQEYWA